MDLILLLRFIKGFLEIKVYDGFTERFINLCSREKIHLWDVTYTNDCLTGKIGCEDFIRLKDIRKKSGTKIKITGKKGLLFYLRRHKNRKFLPLSLTLSLIMMIFMNCFVWSVEVTGSKLFNTEQILNITEKYGLKIGTFTPFFDQSEVSREAIGDFDGNISWIAVNIKGSKATVEVRDFEKDEDELQDTSPCNYIADFDGTIIDADIYSGEQKIFPGSAVKKGTLLISGVTENEDGSINYINSDGVFTAQHTINIKKNYNTEKLFHLVKSNGDYLSVYFFGLNLPVSLTSSLKDENLYSYTEKISFADNILPIGTRKTAAYEITENKNNFSDDKIYQIICVDYFTADEYATLKNSRIINAEYQFQKKNNGCSINGIYSCVDFIGKKSPIINEN